MNNRLGNLADLKLKSGLFKHISGPRLGAKLIMNKNGLLFPMCSSMTLRRPQTSLDSRYLQEDMKNLKREHYRMGLEYHNEVKNSFHLKNIINIRKKKFGSSEI